MPPKRPGGSSTRRSARPWSAAATTGISTRSRLRVLSLRLRFRRVPGWRGIASTTTSARSPCLWEPRGLGGHGQGRLCRSGRLAASALTESSVLVNLGGDLAVAGPPPTLGWVVRIADRVDAGPREPSVQVAIERRPGRLGHRGPSVDPWHPDAASPRGSGDRWPRRLVLADRQRGGRLVPSGQRRLDGGHDPRPRRTGVAGRAGLARPDWYPNAALCARSGVRPLARARARDGRVDPGGLVMLAVRPPSSSGISCEARASSRLVLFTLTVALGVIGVNRWQHPRWPRLVTSGLHKNLSLLALCFLVIHVVTASLDSWVGLGWWGAVIPFQSAYRPLWIGMGVLAGDLLLAVMATSLLRRHVGYRAWRVVHFGAWAMWPLAVSHALGSGTDSLGSWGLALCAVCIAVVGAAASWRLLETFGRSGVRSRRRLAVAPDRTLRRFEIPRAPTSERPLETTGRTR